MKHGSRIAGTACCVALLTACGGLQRVPLSDAARTEVKGVEVRNAVWQDEIVVRPERDARATAVGGLIGAVIQAKMTEGAQNSRQRAVDPLYAAIDDVDVRRQLGQALEARLKQRGTLPLKGVTSTPVLLDKDALADARGALAGGGALLYVATSYTFSDDYNRLEMTAAADMYQAGKADPVFSNLYYYQSASIGGWLDTLARWGENGGEKYRKAIDEAVDQVVAMISLDLGAGAKDAGTTVTANYRANARVTTPITGPALHQQQGRVIVRNAANGRVYSIAQ